MDEIEQKVKVASRFADNFIKVIAVTSFVLFVVSFYVYHYKSGEIYKRQVKLCDAVWSQGLTDQNPLDNPIHESFLSFKNECFSNADRTSEMWGRLAFIALDISILLPIIYFGSKKVVKDSAEKVIRVDKLK